METERLSRSGRTRRSRNPLCASPSGLRENWRTTMPDELKRLCKDSQFEAWRRIRVFRHKGGRARRRKYVNLVRLKNRRRTRPRRYRRGRQESGRGRPILADNRRKKFPLFRRNPRRPMKPRIWLRPPCSRKREFAGRLSAPGTQPSSAARSVRTPENVQPGSTDIIPACPGAGLLSSALPQCAASPPPSKNPDRQGTEPGFRANSRHRPTLLARLHNPTISGPASMPCPPGHHQSWSDPYIGHSWASSERRGIFYHKSPSAGPADEARCRSPSGN